MKKINIEESIKRAMEQAPTVDFEKLVNSTVVKMSEHDYITKQRVEQTPKRRTKIIMGFASCFILLICFLGGWFVQYRVPDSVIYLDVNPSIELVVNKQNHILSVKALNEDAKEIIGGKDYTNDDLTSTVNDILSSMINHGYLSPDKNIIMVSVENEDIKKADNLAIVLDKLIRDGVSSQEISPRILRQTFTKDEAASALAEKYNVSVGKIKLINEILSSCSEFSMDELSYMSIRDLILIANKNAINLNQIMKSDDEYFSNDSNNNSNADNQSGNNDNNDDSTITPDTNKNSNAQSSQSGNNENNDENSTSTPDTNENSNDQSSPSVDNDNNDDSTSTPDTSNDEGS